MKRRRFHANWAARRSPDQGLTWLVKAVPHMDVVGVWRRKRAGMVKRTMKNRMVHRLDWEEEMGFLSLLLLLLLMMEAILG